MSTAENRGGGELIFSGGYGIWTTRSIYEESVASSTYYVKILLLSLSQLVY